jgi:hypothetical protein
MRRSRSAPGTIRSVGWLALLGSVLYFVSDVIEVAQGGFSDAQLWLTLVAEAAVPLIVVGLAAAQRPALGRLGIGSAAAYAWAYVFFTCTVAYALVEDTPDFAALAEALDPWMTLHGAVMVVAGLGFGYAVVRAGVLPTWTGVALGLGVVLVALGLPGALGLVGAGLRDAAFAGMGAAVIRRR